MNILIFTNSTSSRFWRFNAQARYLNKNGHEVFITHAKNWRTDTWIDPDLIVIQMCSNPKMIDFIHEKGGKVIFEADDLMESDIKRKNLDMDEGNIKNYKLTVASCDGVSVTTKAIAKEYRKYNENVYVLPNYLDMKWWGEIEPRPERIDNQVRIGWAGGRTHYEDLKMIAPVIKKLLAKYDFLRWVYCGYGGMSSDRLLTEVGWGEDVFRGIPRDRREFYIGVDPEYWPKKSRTLDFDIAVAPLIDDRFNRCKSNCKWIEYSANKIAGVYSPTVYGKTVEHGVTGYIADTLNEWEHYLDKLILNEQIRQEIASKAHEEVMSKWLISQHQKKWLEVYQRVANQ